MGRKGRGGSAKAKLPSICFYCMREFQDETTLVAHQQARHFRCVECNRKLRTLSAMRHHLDGVHKVQLKRVPNAKEGHDDPNINCVGMDGAPAWFMHQLMAEHGDPAAKEALAAVAGAGAAAAAGVPVGVAVVDPVAAAVPGAAGAAPGAAALAPPGPGAAAAAPGGAPAGLPGAHGGMPVEVATAAAVAGPSGIRFVFTDEAMSPEEKRAMLPRYAKAGIAVRRDGLTA
ncbi:hypothetical protein FNF31_03867 [Cafeteria roenbergensis]|uniref:C2H2-type domain-containing protein n=1 Tax=Cafeteria roenbergensis TaxID=33653 RepID=A0A5A8D8B4_CAFRO|nr:hypothetical protein FNF31_03867 [Cafeteria roenbergensis]